MKALLAAALVGSGTIYFGGVPPLRYQGPATVTLQVVHRSELTAACDFYPPANLELKGCTRSDWLGRRYIILPDPCPRAERDETARILCHELAHAAFNWPGDHPL